MVNDTEGKLGRSRARNLVTAQSDADWIFYLDADDRIHPQAFEAVIPYVGEYDAIWGNILEYSEGICAWRYQVPEIHSLEELLGHDPYLTIGPMGHFVKAEIAKKLPFDEEMDCGEDWDFYLREWKGYQCIKIKEPIIINYRGQHSTGPRSATGRDWMNVVHPMLQQELARLEHGTREYFLESLIKENNFTNGAEIGVWYGRTIGHLLLRCQNLSMIGVDEWVVRPENADINDGETYEDWDMEHLEHRARHVVDHWGERGKIIKASSLNAAKQIEDESLDFVFIDASHDYRSVLTDIGAWEPKVRAGGMVSGHDIDWQGVRKALQELGIQYQTGPDNVWYYFK